MMMRRSLIKTLIWAVGVLFVVVSVATLHGMLAAQDSYMRVYLHKLGPHEVNTHAFSGNTNNTSPSVNDAEVDAIKLQETMDRLSRQRQEVRHLGFLKIHKAASTTTQAIFLRFGWRRNLTFVLPPEKNPFGYPNIISTNESMTQYNVLPPPPGKQFDIMCHHVFYGKEAWAAVLPADTVNVGTVREPFSHLNSVLNYFNPRTISRIAETSSEPMKVYLTDPLKYEAKNPRYSFLNNRLSIEYGIDPEIIIRKDFDAFNDYIKNVLDKEFAVVIVANKFDESLVLMKRILGWSLNDIMYANKNVHNVKKPNRYELKEEYKPLHKAYAVFDYILYEFFDKKLAAQIEKEGSSFPVEVEHFKKARKAVELFCHVGKRKAPSFTVAPSPFNEMFQITVADCNVMHEGEIAFTQKIRKLQYGKAEWGVKH